MAFLKIDNQINLIPIYIYSTVHIQLLLLPLPPPATEPPHPALPRPTALPRPAPPHCPAPPAHHRQLATAPSSHGVTLTLLTAAPPSCGVALTPLTAAPPSRVVAFMLPFVATATPSMRSRRLHAA
jgi:hypothetical protein